jgi:dihydroxy-acid dehydratase
MFAIETLADAVASARKHALPAKECVVTVRDRRADLLVSDEELARRSVVAGQSTRRGYAALYQQEILQADYGCDFDFLHHTPLRR